MKKPGITRARGFTLVEVLVSLIIISVGLLGLAKIETVAYASTGVASQQSLAALQAASLASAMRANRGYWAGVAAGTIYNSATAATNTYACALPAGTAFTSALCTPTQLAAYDLQDWFTNSLSKSLPNPTAKITCNAASGTSPLGCWITINWVEENVAINSQSTTGTLSPPTYTLYVVP
jgi:type IV pilus assembly protein PilV